MRTIIRRATMTVGTAGLLLGGGAALAGGAQAATGNTTLEAIKQCESGGSYTAQNPTSTASGAYQFLTSTWRSLDASAGYATAASAPASVQDAAALELYQQSGTTPWNASRGCWSGNVGASGATGSATSASTSTTSSAAGTADTAGSTSNAGASAQTASTGSATTDRPTPRSSERAGTKASAEKPDRNHRQAPTSGVHQHVKGKKAGNEIGSGVQHTGAQHEGRSADCPR